MQPADPRADAADARCARSEDPAAGLAAALRERTRALHVQAERSGIVREILRGRASRHGYALLLRNLLPAYRELERGLERHRHAPGVRAAARPVLYRAPALAADLAALCGPAWSRSLPLLPAGERYADRVAAAGSRDGARLIGHAYARYLGDLSGGQILRRLLGRSLGLGPGCLAFYDFPDIPDPEGFKAGYRAALDRAALEIVDVDGVVEEAAAAFRLNIEVSEAVLAAVTDQEALAPALPG
jgi:heme oxygenase